MNKVFWSLKFNEDFYQEIRNDKYHKKLALWIFWGRKSFNVLRDHISKRQIRLILAAFS